MKISLASLASLTTLASLALGVGSLPGTAAAQECDRCSFASYLQSAVTPGSEHHLALQLDYTYRNKTYNGTTKISGAPDEKVADTTLNLFYSQPLFSRTFVDFNVPVVSRAYTLRPNNTYESDRETSFGDASILLTVQPVKGPGSDWRIRGGVKLPTGDSDRLNDFNVNNQNNNGGSAVYPYDLVGGTGSTDFILGSSLFLRGDRLMSMTDVQWTARTEGENNFTYGDKVVLQTAPGFVFFEKESRTISLLANTTFKYTGEAEQDGQTVTNSGQKILAVGPQILLAVPDHFSGTVGFNFPVYNDVNGTQVSESYELLASIMVGF